MTKSSIKLEDVITIGHFVKALKACMRSVGFKFSVQKYVQHALHHIAAVVRFILAGGKPVVTNSQTTVIRERGKERIITPIVIDDRVVQRVLCDYALVPVIIPHLIYDNGASTQDKGVSFARKRLLHHICSAIKEWGVEHVYVLKIDFKSYFDSIPHAECYRVLNKYFEDKRIVDLVITIIESYKLSDINKIEDATIRSAELDKLRNHECVGICLGSQISQVMALVVPNDYDHYIKDKLGIKYYMRYMDDGVILLNSKEKLTELKEELREVASRYGLTLHPKKTMIVKLTKGFTFMKVRYRATGEGKVIKTLCRDGVTRERRKLKKFEAKVESGIMTMDDVYSSMQSWLTHAKIAKHHHTVKRMIMLYDDLYGGYKVSYKYFRAHPEAKRKKRWYR